MSTAVTGAVRTSELLHEVIEGHDPGRVAMRFRGGTTVELTFGRLDHRSNQLAHALRAAGIRSGDVVALLLERGPDLLIAELAVMKAGAVWMPLDPQHPPARLGFQASDAATPLVLTTADFAGLAREAAPHVPAWTLDAPAETARLAGFPATPPDSEVRPEDGAYVMYTSGSTGKPKGVLISHRAAHTYCRNAIEQMGTTGADRVPQMANPAFDLSIFDCYATLLAGATIISAPRDVITEPTALTALLREERVTIAYLAPSILALLDPRQLTDSALRGICCGGMVLPTELLNRWSRPGLDIHNSYGPTETTVFCTDYRCPDTPVDGPVPIGTAMPHHRAYVLDKRLRPVPVGVSGQLYMSGKGLAHGYLNRPGLTAKTFLPDPHPTEPGQRMYATGDLARWRSDGQLDFIGRIDRQVQLRGQRVELGEIEHVLNGYPAVRQCAVTVRDEDLLVAYLVGDPDYAEPSPADLRGQLARQLPAYMIPSTFVVLPELPLTSNGKLDLASLPAPEAATAPYTAPRTDTERWLAAAWQELLGIEQVGVGDSFFDLGGNSLHAIQLAGRIRDGLHVDFRPEHVFASQVLEQLAARLDETEGASDGTAIVPVSRNGELPCTHQQEGMWFMQRMDPSSPVYHIPFTVRLSGALDVPTLERALLGLMKRHEALRTRFVAPDGLPFQVIDPPPAAYPLPVTELTVDDAEYWAAEHAQRPFDLLHGPVFRVALARLTTGEHLLSLVVHHIIADGWSAKLLAGELSLLYAVESGLTGVELPPAPQVQPADHAVWQRGRLDGAEMARQIGFWRETLAELSTLDFPADRPRPTLPTGAGASIARPLPGDLAAAAYAYAKTHQVSFLAVLQAGLLTVLHRYTGEDDIAIGSIFSGRTRPEVEPVVGFFANAVVLRTDLGGEPTFTELVRRCHDTVMNAAAHQEIPFGLLVDELQPERVPGRNPLFQISLTLQPTNTQADLSLGEVSAGLLRATRDRARFDIAVEVVENGDQLELEAEYSTELFDADRIDRLLDHYTTALTHGLAAPDSAADDFDIMSAAELGTSPNGSRATVAPVTRGYVPPRTDTQRWLATQWQHLLRAERVGAGDSFFDLGGNSLHITQLAARIRGKLGHQIHPWHLFLNPTLEQFAEYVDQIPDGPADTPESLVPLRPQGTQPPLFLVHPSGGAVTHYLPLVSRLDDDQPVHAIEDPELRGAAPTTSLPERAAHYVELIRRAQPAGPYRLGGWSLGGNIAVEMARQLTDSGERVDLVVALDSAPPVPDRVPTDLELLAGFVLDVTSTAGAPPPEVDLEALRGLDQTGLENQALDVLARAGLAPVDTHDELRSRMRAFATNLRQLAEHRQPPYHGRLVLISGRDNTAPPDLPAWLGCAPRLEHRSVPGDHYTMLRPPHVNRVATALGQCLSEE